LLGELAEDNQTGAAASLRVIDAVVADHQQQ
jgi:hypothetical protein